MKLFSDVQTKPDVPKVDMDCHNESESWQNSIELPDHTDGLDNSSELTVGNGEWIDNINLEDSSSATFNDDASESKLEETIKDYFEDLLSKSEFPETLSDTAFDASDMEKLSPEETALMREEFDDVKASLKQQWEEENGQPWPKYEKDIYSANGKLIRKAGSDYDAHHIQPLGLGGKNEASNITPLHAEVHYDKQGIHAPDSPYSKMDKLLGGVN